MILKNFVSPSWFLPTTLSSYISLSSFFLSLLFLLQYPLLIYGGSGGGDDVGSNVDGSNEWNCEHNNVQELIKTSPVILKALGANIFADDILALKQQKQLQIVNNKKNKEEKKYFYLKENYYTQKQNKRKSSSSPSGYYDRIDYDDEIDFNNDKKSWITLSPETIYKGASLLKVARTQTSAGPDIFSGDNVAGRILDESYRYAGQLNATLEPIGCFDKDILNLLPTELIIFGKLISNINEQQQHHIQDILKISINGLHRWTPQFENQIWKYLGWDDWSDFTLCSVTCGKGVQQRFRRCLLDSPSTTTPFPTTQLSIDDNLIDINQQQYNQKHFYSTTLQQQHISSQEIVNDDNTDDADDDDDDDDGIYIYNKHHHHNRYRSVRIQINNDGKHADNNNDKNTKSSNYKKSGTIKKLQQQKLTQKKPQQQKQRWKKKRKTKGLTTLSCEGYNIEQRNCNMFECGDDISDLLKFYKKTLTVNETMLNLGTTFSTSAATTLMMSSLSIGIKENNLTNFNTLGTTTTTTITTQPTRNQEFLHGWKFFTNFTLMITLRVKIPPTQSTIFSVRNLTHNLYLDQSENGLKFFQERDEVTEMLPIKFDLYDNRWHQIAISVQNGDFITVYVDCLWTNSFVVSKRLFALPDGADVEIGREFNGELQQLSILPGNQEKLQCSTVRTSINEVKRYIIDTFIDDYGN